MLRSNSAYPNFMITKDCEYVNPPQTPALISNSQILNSRQIVIIKVNSEACALGMVFSLVFSD